MATEILHNDIVQAGTDRCRYAVQTMVGVDKEVVLVDARSLSKGMFGI